MKIRAPLWLSLAAIAGATVAQAQAPAPGSAVLPPAPKGWLMHQHGHGPMAGGRGFGMALHQLNLTADQKTQIKTIMGNARASAKAQWSNGNKPDFAVLNNPGDPNYATALQAEQARATARIQQEDAVRQQIYSVLTPEQKAQLPSVLAGIKARMATMRAQHAAQWDKAEPQ